MVRVNIQGKHSPHDLKHTCWCQGWLFSSVVEFDLLGTPGSLLPQIQCSVEISKRLELVKL